MKKIINLTAEELKSYWSAELRELDYERTRFKQANVFDVFDHVGKGFGRTRSKKKYGASVFAVSDSRPITIRQYEKTLRAKGREGYAEGKKPALILKFIETRKNTFVCYAGGVNIFLLHEGGKWCAYMMHQRKMLMQAYEATEKEALAKLCGYRWFFHHASLEWWSLYDLYRTVFFDLPFGRKAIAPSKGRVMVTIGVDWCNGRFVWDVMKKRIVVHSPRLMPVQAPIRADVSKYRQNGIETFQASKNHVAAQALIEQARIAANVWPMPQPVHNPNRKQVKSERDYGKHDDDPSGI